MKNFALSLFVMFFAAAVFAQEFREISVKDYRDKMKGGWIGQIAGVCWGAPTEFKWKDKIIPEDKMPVWKPEMINEAFGQDDLYVEMTFLRSLEEYGLDVSIRQAGIDFANSEYNLWCANAAGRKNLRAGIAPPDSSHPKFNKCPNDIDYQIEADFSGLIAPGMPNVSIALGQKFGRLMNYGDGVYGGIFVGGMYAEAFFETDILKIIDAGLKCIPSDSQYAEMVRDVVAWYKANPDDWEATWNLCQKKYREAPEYQKASNGGIDVKINGAYILIGMLFGKGDLDKTIIISTRCGQDSDCNPSNAAGVLFTTLGFSKLPPRFTEKLDETKKFSFTAYTVPELLDVCEKLARQFVIREGGQIKKDASGNEVFVIPVKKPVPPKLELSWDPGPIANSLFTEEERAKIRFKGFRKIEDAVAALLPGWSVKNCGPDMDPGMREQYRGKKNVIMTHPLNREVPCALERRIDVPANKKTVLKAVVSNHQEFDWELVIRVNGSVQKTVTIDKELTKGGWAEVDFDLTPFAGSSVQVELENKANGWMCEAGYWSKIAVE
ncbi:MAG: ADP-ribosylglycohydrolase family protein [Planctomycetaceae bacterium]|nr:ADP-ribosylglycohydrolase family protein [Planctomycetaceae bacterium]